MNELVYMHMTLLSRRFQLKMARGLSGLGIGLGQYGLLLKTCHEPGISQDTLAERSVLNKSTVARAAAMLEQGGYVRREKNPADRRELLVYPTPKALSCVEEIKRCERQSAAEMNAALSPQELDQLAELLARMFAHSEQSLAAPPDQVGSHTDKNEMKIRKKR